MTQKIVFEIVGQLTVALHSRILKKVPVTALEYEYLSVKTSVTTHIGKE